jgi:hypothetical protein
MCWLKKLEKKAEAWKKEEPSHPDDSTGPRTVDMAIVEDFEVLLGILEVQAVPREISHR